MYSSKGEYVPFLKTIKAGEAVEQWLIEVEMMMRMTIIEETIKSYNDYVKMERTDWV